ncbi:MAG: lipopolysaccharide heptosyltransferase I [Burkholderiales bacterium]|nr:lipopolysaccharide heptosyltransferase I [Burkholderiales bacterium]
MRILIVKLSSLGDVVHALPVVADIHAAHPGATIDWVVEPGFASLLGRVAGLAGVIELPLRRWSKSGWLGAATRGEMGAFVRRLRQERYDAVIDLQGLTKSALVSVLARGPGYGLANRTEGASHEWPARWLVTHAIRVEPHSHALDRSRELVARAIGTTVSGAPLFGLAAAKAATPERSRIVFIHGTSRADKLWPEASWIELGRRLVAAGGTIALPRADAEEHARALRIAAALGDACEVWPAMDLGALIDRMAATGGAIGVDSGPSHIAVALDLPHVQIYNHPTAWRTGPQVRHGHRHQVSIEAQPTPDVDAVWAAWQQVQGAAPRRDGGQGER